MIPEHAEFICEVTFRPSYTERVHKGAEPKNYH